MSQTFDLHQKAMSLLDEAMAARKRGDEDAACRLRLEAFATEKNAAHLLADRLEMEPTRSMLYKGAAVLALECGLAQEAEQLARTGLAGDPPYYIANQLQSVLEKALAAYTRGDLADMVLP